MKPFRRNDDLDNHEIHETHEKEGRRIWGRKKWSLHEGRWPCHASVIFLPLIFLPDYPSLLFFVYFVYFVVLLRHSDLRSHPLTISTIRMAGGSVLRAAHHSNRLR